MRLKLNSDKMLQRLMQREKRKCFQRPRLVCSLYGNNVGSAQTGMKLGIIMTKHCSEVIGHVHDTVQVVRCAWCCAWCCGKPLPANQRCYSKKQYRALYLKQNMTCAVFLLRMRCEHNLALYGKLRCGFARASLLRPSASVNVVGSWENVARARGRRAGIPEA